jgi:hypothetical protein
MECARRQPSRLKDDAPRVARAAELCRRHGVKQLEVDDSSLGKYVVRLQRTDGDAPKYPDNSSARAA